MRCERWSGCTDDVAVELCALEGGGHTWPGGPDLPGFGATTRTISASELMWAFFSAHPR